MSLIPDEILSAQVILRSASGQSPIESRAITAENIDRFVPPPGIAAWVATTFQSLGFDTGPLVGISFSITGSVRLFRKVFGATLCQTDDEGVACLYPSGATGMELPLERLEPKMLQAIHAVTFTPPDQFDAIQ
jgi:hypothetical protein